MRSAVLGVAVAVWAIVPVPARMVGPVEAAGAAGAAGAHHAAVVVDTGSGVHEVLISFDTDSISGLQALQAAGADPVVLAYGSLGGAVCSLYGVGHAADSSSCLGSGSDPRYWEYWEAPPGAGAFGTPSGSGAGRTQVHDGGVEGWKFESGSTPPPFVTVTQLGGGSPGPPAGPPQSGAAAGRAAPGQPVAPGATANRAVPRGNTPGPAGSPAVSGPTPTTPGATATPGAHTDARRRVAAERASAPARHPGAGSPWSLIAFGALLAALVGAIVVVRRARAMRSRPG